MIKPKGKPSRIHQQLLGIMLEPNPSQKLARNVSWSNIDRAAARWTP